MVHFRKVFLALVLWFTLFAPPLHAEDQRQLAIVSVIQQQLTAFAAGDGRTAFSFAPPSIRRIFGNPQQFMQMVTAGYDALVAPLSVEVQSFEGSGRAAMQSIGIVARDGSAWVAHYSMQQMESGDWRIAGVTMERLPGGTV